MLPKHPDQYTDAELNDWIVRLVNDGIPEGPQLDYKADAQIGTPSTNKELAKDITSFANEIGGTLVYGVPQNVTTTNGAPTPTRPYGIDCIPDFNERLENVLTDVISRTLPEYRIREIASTEYPGKVCYVVWTPESWIGPHMVHGYDENRFYRRGQFRAIPMTERDVEDRYRRRQSLRSAADEFSHSRDAHSLMDDYGNARANTKLIVIPTVLVENRVNFLGTKEREWLDANTLWRQWLPSMYGVRTSLDKDDGIKADLQIYRNGSVVAGHYTLGSTTNYSGTIAEIDEFQRLLEYLTLTGEFYQFLSYTGPLSIYLQVTCPRKPTRRLVLPRLYGADLELLPRGTDIEIAIEPAASELSSDPMATLRDLADRLCQAFGLWRQDFIAADGKFQRTV